MNDAFERFFSAYLECALWSSHDWTEDGSDGGSLEDFELTRAARATLRRDCRAFWREVRGVLARGVALDSPAFPAERAGHDFWLTRNRHGAGFWDGGWPEPVASQLTKASKAYGSVDLYLARGRVHVS